MRKRITSLLLVLALCLTLLPTEALAEELQNEAPSTPQEEIAADDPTDEETPDQEEPGTDAPSDEEPEGTELDQPSVQANTETGAEKTDEIFKISSADDLEAFSKRVNGGESSLNAVLVKDVSRGKNYSWESIKGYTGVFDGNGHTITLSVGGRGENTALFGSIASGGIVQDLTIQIYSWGVERSSETGSVAYSNAGTIQRCQALSRTGGKKIGGIVYQNESEGVVKDCRVGTLKLGETRENLVGGIAYVNNGLIQDCYISGKLQSTYDGTRTDLSSATAIVRTNNGTVENCYYLQYDSEAAVAGTPMPEAAFASGEVAYKLNGGKTELDSVWRQNLPENTDGLTDDTLPVTDASHGRVYYDSGTYYSLVPHLHGAEELTAWQQTNSLPSDSGMYYLTGNVTLTSGQKMDKNVTLCLNGHGVTGNVTVTGGSFTLTDCGSGSAKGNVTVNEGGSFTLDCALSGSIKNNGTLTVSGGIVTASESTAVTNLGTFTMTSGTITAANGTGVANGGTLTMNGGTVTGCDRGIEGSGTMTVSGKVQISGNANGNLVLPDGETIDVGILDSTATIGITAEKQGDLTAGGSIRLTNGGAAYLARFFADDAAAYGIFADGDDLVMRLRSEHTHCICGHPADSAGDVGDHTEHTDVTFLPWTSGDDLPIEGNYYLTQNVVLDKTKRIYEQSRSHTISLCLNGYSISVKDGSRPISVSGTCAFSTSQYFTALTLTDCAAQQGSVVSTSSQAVNVSSCATVNIFGGTYRGGICTSSRADCNAYIYGGKFTGGGTGITVDGGNVYMYDGEVSGNSCGVQAGGQYNKYFYGSFYLHGGKITDNHGSQGGGVYVMSYFFMDGGEVSDNTATGDGGGVYMRSGSISLSGGKVTGNWAGGNGGGVCTKAYIDDRSYVNLSGNAEISDNYAGGRGGGVYLDVIYSYLGNGNYCTLAMNGGSITGNTSVGDGGGVYAGADDSRDAKSYVNVQGSARITSNKKGEEDNNLYLPSLSEGITIGGNLDKTADIRVTTETKPSEGSNVTIAKKSVWVDSVTVPDGVFKADGTGGSISVDKEGTVKLMPCAHSWTYTANSAAITAECGICSASGGSVTIAAPADLIYSGNGKAAVVTASDDWQGQAAEKIVITYMQSDPKLVLESGAVPTNAGTYTADITVEGQTASITYTITPRLVDVVWEPATLTKVYDSTTDSNLAIQYFCGRNDDSGSRYTLTRDADYAIQAAYRDPNASPNAQISCMVKLINLNYAFGFYDGVALRVLTAFPAATITQAQQTITVPTDKILTKNGKGIDISTWGEAMGIANGSKPGKLTYTLNGIYTGVTLDGVVLTAAKDATETSVTITVSAAATQNYEAAEKTFTVALTDRAVQGNFRFSENTVDKTYGDGAFMLAAVGAVKGSTVSYDSSNKDVATVDGDGTVTILKAGTTTITATASDTDDYQAASASYALTVGKKAIDIPTENPTVFTYNGQPQTYTLTEDEAYTISGSTRTNANESGYTVTVALKDPANTKWADDTIADKVYSFVIKQATATVTVKDKSAYVGAVAPDLSKPEAAKDYTVVGLFGNDALGGTLVLTYDPAPDMTKAGEVAIKASGAVAPDGNNYIVKYVDGKLTISNRSSGGSSVPTNPVNIGRTKNGTVSVSPKNASKGGIVTITVTPDKGYELDAITVKDANGNTLKLTGKGSGQYTFTMPGSKVTISAEFAKTQTSVTFADVPADSYYADAMAWAVKNSITNGVSSERFAPDDLCTRAQIVTFLWRAAGSPAPKSTSHNFTDVKAGCYYEQAVLWAVENGITVGTSSTAFSPDATCTRAQAVTFLYRASGSPAVSGIAEFSDVLVTAYYADAVTWAAKKSITNGIGGGIFGADYDCTRAQIVTFLWRLFIGE